MAAAVHSETKPAPVWHQIWMLWAPPRGIAGIDGLYKYVSCFHRSLTVFRMQNLLLKLLLLVLILQLSLVCALHNFFHAELATLYVL